MKASSQFSQSKIDFPWHFTHMIMPWKMFMIYSIGHYPELLNHNDNLSIVSSFFFGTEIKNVINNLKFKNKF